MSKQGSPTLVPNEVIRASKKEKLYQIEMLSELHKTQKDNSTQELSKVQEDITKIYIPNFRFIIFNVS